MLEQAGPAAPASARSAYPSASPPGSPFRHILAICWPGRWRGKRIENALQRGRRGCGCPSPSRPADLQRPVRIRTARIAAARPRIGQRVCDLAAARVDPHRYCGGDACGCPYAMSDASICPGHNDGTAAPRRWSPASAPGCGPHLMDRWRSTSPIANNAVRRCSHGDVLGEASPSTNSNTISAPSATSADHPRPRYARIYKAARPR